MDYKDWKEDWYVYDREYEAFNVMQKIKEAFDISTDHYKFIEVRREKYLLNIVTGERLHPTETVLTYSEARTLVDELNQYLREIEREQSKLICGEKE